MALSEAGIKLAKKIRINFVFGVRKKSVREKKKYILSPSLPPNYYLRPPEIIPVVKA
jgi:hypothetical protein